MIKRCKTLTVVISHVSLFQITFPIRVMKLFGIETLIVTNAAGALNRNYSVGDIMVIKDHINLPGLCGTNPLTGPNDDRFGPRFPAMSDAYDRELRDLTKKVASELKMDFVKEGVYIVQGGPCFETVAECRMMMLLGADVTGRYINLPFLRLMTESKSIT